MKKKRIVFWFLVLFMVVMLTMFQSGSFAAAEKQITVRFNHGHYGSPAATVIEEFAKLVEARTNGRIKVSITAREELGTETEMHDLMRTSIIEMGSSASTIISDIVPEYGSLILPYIFSSADNFKEVINGSIGKGMMQKILERNQIRIIGWLARNPRHLTTKNRIVREPEDLDGLKIRIREIPVQIEAWRALGASPIPIAWAEVYTALQTGVVDAQENPGDIIAGSSFYEVQNYLMLTGHVREAYWFYVAEVWWKTLDSKDQEIIQKAMDEAVKMGEMISEEAEQKAIQVLKNNGVQIIELTADEILKFQEKVADVPKLFKDTWDMSIYEAIVASGKN